MNLVNSITSWGRLTTRWKIRISSRNSDPLWTRKVIWFDRPGAESQAPSQSTQTNKTERSRYKHIQAECVVLLDCLGVTSVTSKGEAEAGCASLNFIGAVDGCITKVQSSWLFQSSVRCLFQTLPLTFWHWFLNMLKWFRPTQFKKGENYLRYGQVF